MLFLLSPAKTLDYETPLPQALAATQPVFNREAGQLIGLLRGYSPPQLATLMSLSDKLAALNVARYHAWRSRPGAASVRPAVFAFNGDVYEGLDARSLDAEALHWAQQHVAILSGLYGVLRPLDALQPYRLEMGTRLPNPQGATLYRFWATLVADELTRRLVRDPSPVVVNLASQEYFKAVDTGRLKARVVECVFEEAKPDGYKVISFLAKRARGLMARYAIHHRLALPTQLQSFDLEGYRYAPAASQAHRLVFRRA